MGEENKSSLFPTYGRFPITIVKGEGSRLWDDTGKEYLDLMTGIAVTNLGHAPKQIKEKLVEQLDQLWHISNLFGIPNQEKLAKLLTDNSCADAVFFCNSGAEANEAAIKLARRYNQKVLGNERYEIVTFKQSFHGRTLATLTATGQAKVQEGFLPLPEGFVYAPYNDAEALKGYVNDKTCAIMLELVQAEGGIILADPDFLKEVVRLCKEHNLQLIVDEIQTGMGRTGTLFAYEQFGIEPDIFTLAKGIASGFPMGAMLGKAHLREAFGPGSHGSTFGGTPIATAAGIATLETIVGEQLPQRAAELGAFAVRKLSESLNGNPFVKEIRGKGLIIGIECAEPVAGVISDIHQEGVLAITAGPNVIRLLPSLLISEEELGRGLDVICSVLAKRSAAAVQ
ncbi:acetylornithine transaminase [Paenibacillus contaminans]|uniref:Acetylornithine aminotransferase n=1 Tax=Paenibacillus contaminans TaxID=450362 RepID=A0A329MDN6_9BACL|nr:acetylornithine transaminase [Paenibacillus contaminans]RAV17416.1 acetylornithine transaminase [Paenibacillus contaminans]